MSILGIRDSGERIVTNGLILRADAFQFRSYETTGRTWFDISGNNNHGTASCSTGGTFVDDCANYPPFVSGSIRYWDFTPNSSGNNRMMTFSQVIPTTGSFSIEIWIRRNNTSVVDRESLFSNTSGGDGYRYGISSDGRLYYLIGGVGAAGYSEGNIGSGYSVTTDTWTQTAIVWDRAAQLGSYQVIAHSNGVQRGTATISSGNQAFVGEGNPGISRWCCARYKGFASIVNVYNRALSAAEITQNFNAQKARFGL